MITLVNQLSPRQVDALLSAYNSVEAWFDAVIQTIGDTTAIVIEDVML